jgi:Flp pilus assembly protein TadD
VYAIALAETTPETALTVLRGVLDRHPYNRPAPQALATMNRDDGHTQEAVGYARRIVELWPSDPGAQSLLTSLLSEL